jgi:hypothetical protein
MERVFSVEEIPNPYWAPPQPQAAAAGAVAAPGGGVRGGGGGAGGVGDDMGAMNRCSSEWYFQKFLEEAVLDSPGPVASVGSGCGGVGVGIEAAESKPLGVAAASSSAVDPVEYNAMLKQKLEKDLAAVAMWRV